MIQAVNNLQDQYQKGSLSFQTTSSLFKPCFSRIESASDFSNISSYLLCLYDDIFNKTIEINHLEQYDLKEPIVINIKQDGEGYLATVENLPNYFYAESISEVIKGIKIDVEDLYEELNELEPQLIKGKWKEHRDYLNSIIISEK